MSEEQVRNEIAGLLSTIDFQPSQHHPELLVPWADRVLAALRDAGFEVYRPEEYEMGELLLVQTGRGVYPSFVVPVEGGSFDDLPLRSRFRLVPVSGESPKEEK